MISGKADVEGKIGKPRSFLLDFCRASKSPIKMNTGPLPSGKLLTQITRYTKAARLQNESRPQNRASGAGRALKFKEPALASTVTSP